MLSDVEELTDENFLQKILRFKTEEGDDEKKENKPVWSDVFIGYNFRHYNLYSKKPAVKKFRRTYYTATVDRQWRQLRIAFQKLHAPIDASASAEKKT